MTPDTGRLRERIEKLRAERYEAVPMSVGTALSLCDAADRAVRLEEALRTLHDRLMACAAPISARDAYDSFYQQIVLEALK